MKTLPPRRWHSKWFDMGRGLRRVPVVLTAEELLDRAFTRAQKAAQRSEGQTKNERVRAQMLRMTQSAADVFSGDLRGWVRGWPSLDQMSHLDRALLDATVGSDSYRLHLGSLDWAAARIMPIARQHLFSLRQSEDLEEIHQLRRSAYGRYASIINQISPALAWLRKVHGILSDLPHVDDDEPCVVVAGAPNVGKSALIGALSSAQPEVAGYPFTTQRIHVGHLIPRRRSIQMIDTPGLLDRAEDERNEIERQTIAALAHTGDVALFILDPSETCGTPFGEQVDILSDVRSWLGDTPVWVVEAKADLWRDDDDAWKSLAASEARVAEDRLQSGDESSWVSPETLEPISGPNGSVASVSVHDGVGVESLRYALTVEIGQPEVGDPWELPDNWPRRE